ncbi:hypothetical protein PLEOSDRAFT_1103810 [Pleurotus ostreatus PC15]|uniref:Uncharacterized protein n=2 Tax=Pleurotus TaxID=5320 RepID=A0A067NPD2_PLEO1|nr:hypothetical protein CCMSSC00406_0001318 [Pleurotus cornucopiae]KDQ29794.1 hypothetical protein PLEOSDRAFT_1103810 [Pleurotus ostreatus PC15]
MTPVNIFQFSIKDQKHSFELEIPPSAHGHVLHISIDGTTNKGTVTVSNNTAVPYADPERPHPGNTSHCHGETALDESVKNWRPFSGQQPTGTSSRVPATYHTSRSAFLPGKRDTKATDQERPSGEDTARSPRRYHGITVYPPTSTLPKQFASPSRPQDNTTLKPNGSNRFHSCRRDDPDYDAEDSMPAWAELREVYHGSKEQKCTIIDNDEPDGYPADNINDDPNHPSNLPVPFHRLPPRAAIDGDLHPEMFAVPLGFRHKYNAPAARNGAGKQWWAVAKGYEIGVFCDKWVYIQALTSSIGFQKKAQSWKQAIAFYNEYERSSKTQRLIK